MPHRFDNAAFRCSEAASERRLVLGVCFHLPLLGRNTTSQWRYLCPTLVDSTSDSFSQCICTFRRIPFQLHLVERESGRKGNHIGHDLSCTRLPSHTSLSTLNRGHVLRWRGGEEVEDVHEGLETQRKRMLLGFLDSKFFPYTLRKF